MVSLIDGSEDYIDITEIDDKEINVIKNISCMWKLDGKKIFLVLIKRKCVSNKGK